MKTEVFDSPAAFLEAAGLAPKRQKRGRATRPDIPSAGRAAPTGLSTLILAAWSLEYVVGRGYRLYRINGKTTGWHPTEAAVCKAAKELAQ